MRELKPINQTGPAKSFRPRARPSEIVSTSVAAGQESGGRELEAASVGIQQQLQDQYGVDAVLGALSGASTDPFSTVIVAEWALGMAELPGLLGTSNEALGQVHSTLSSPEFAETCQGILSRHAAGVGGPVHVEKALALIRQSRGQRLPEEVAARLSQALGTDVSDARVHTDGAAAEAAKAVNAHAFATGRDIFFAPNKYKPGTRSGDELLLHELTHVVQDAEGRLPTPTTGAGPDVSSPNDAHEREAVREASSAVDRLYSGEIGELSAASDGADIGEEAGVERSTADGGVGASAALHRSVENPSLPTDGDTTDEWGTRHESAKVGEGFPSKDSKVPEGSTSETRKERDMEVRLLRTRKDPLKGAMSGISDDDLFAVMEGSGQGQCTGEGIAVVEQHGTGADPNVEVRAASDSLYIGGGPKTADIQQGNIGDCYFLSALLTVLNQDPERVRRCISMDGDNVRFSFWTTNDNGTTWTKTSVTTDRTTVQWTDTTNPSEDYGMYGAGARVGPDPVDAEHFAEVSGDTLKVYRADIYEMAMWAPLMEKAYALIAEKTNQYGGFKTGSSVYGAGPGYDQIDGGFEAWVYGLFYGPDLVATNQTTMAFAAGQDVVQLNAGAIETLLQLQGYRAGEGSRVNSDEHVMVNASTGQTQAIERLLATITHCSGLDEMKRYTSLRRVLAQIEALATEYQTRVDAGAAPEIQDAALSRLSKGCDRQVQPGAWPMLENPKSNKHWHDLHEALAIVGQLGTDSSDGTRNVYANHAYAVLGAQFFNHEGRPMALNIDNLSTELGQVSGEHSRVQLQNPHRTNEPNLPSSMVDSDVDDGVFQMSLDAYLRAFGAHEIGRVKDT